MTTIAIAMATFNGEAYLAEQLASLAKQTLAPAELIVVDDGSSDGTINLLDSFRCQAPFSVRLYKNAQRLGYRASFIKAANLCSADAIAFCDQDDIWSPAKIEMLQRTFNDNPETLLIYHNSMIVNERAAPLTTTFSSTVRSRATDELGGMSPCLIIPGHAQAFRRSLNIFTELHVASVDPYAQGELMPHDMWIPFWASSLSRVTYLSDMLVKYRMHGANTSGWHLSWWSFATDHICNAAMYAQANKTIAQNREDLLRRGRHLVEQTQLPLLDAAIEFYRHFNVRASQRALIYKQPSFFARASAFLKLLGRRNYEWGSRCHGLDAFLLDLTVGVLCSRLGRSKN